MKVENMVSARGNTIPNQFIICGVEGFNPVECFQSYKSIIVKKVFNGLAPIGTIDQIYLDKNKWNYSITTGKYRNQFLGETIKETHAKIKSGEYKLADLNG